MTEEEWMGETDAVEMMVFLRFGHESPRKLALFAIAACRLIWDRLDERSRDQVLAAEQAEGAEWNVPEPELFMRTLQRREIGVFSLRELQRHPSDPQAADFVRDIFGNPFRPVAVDPGWLTSTVVALARGIYDDRAFERMPILADALEDSGCDHADVLAHCRGAEATHVRGCWVVDLLLGKT
jgi:hypothetical protein